MNQEQTEAVLKRYRDEFCYGNSNDETVIRYSLLQNSKELAEVFKSFLLQELSTARNEVREEIEEDYINWVITNSYGTEYKGKTNWSELKQKSEARDMKKWD